MKDNLQPKLWTTATFDRLSKYYDWFMKLFYPIGEKGRVNIAMRLNTGSVLDVACGTGTLLDMAREKGLLCYGVDLSQGMLDQARVKIPDAELTRASFYAIPYPDGYFDYVVATNALSGVFIEARKVIMEMFRVCKSGGELFLAEWPKALEENLKERLIVKLASLNDDAPKDYLKIFRELGVEPRVEVLGQRYNILVLQNHDRLAGLAPPVFPTFIP
jgi:ubiquinone/menaquinone biosynthesis C-methylase UbiE